MKRSVKTWLRNLLFGPPPTMAFEDWLDDDKVRANTAYPWLKEEWRDIAISYALAYVYAGTVR